MIHLRPSQSSIWTRCALAPRLWADVDETGSVPDLSGDAAKEGTCAAWVAETVLKGHTWSCADTIGRQHPNGWVVDGEMAHHVQGYVDTVRGYGGKIDTERKVKLNDYISGTADSVATLDDGTLRIDDLKYGYRVVPVTSPQIVIYAGAVVRHMTARDRKPSKVILGVYQPRAYHPSGTHRVRTLWPEELMDEVREIEKAASACQDPSALATPGSHCRYCPAASMCSAVTHEIYATYETMCDGQQRQMTSVELAQELEFLARASEMLKGRTTAIKAEAEARHARGDRIPGWHLTQGYGNRKWSATPSTVLAMTGVDPSDSSKMVSPAELERRGADKELVAMLTERPVTSPRFEKIPEGYYEALFREKEQEHG